MAKEKTEQTEEFKVTGGDIDYSELYDIISEFDCVTESMTPGEQAAIIDKYYDF